jgi:hypothetical protein
MIDQKALKTSNFTLAMITSVVLKEASFLEARSKE